MFVTTTRRPLPFQSLRLLGNALDEAFLSSSWSPACDVLEDKDSVKFLLELPGVTADDVKLSLENDVLTIRGEKKQQAEEGTERVHRYERSYGAFERSFALPSTIDAEKVTATFQNGILTVTVPKAERARPREIPVQAA